MNIKSYFPITANTTYLDTAAFGLISKNVYESKLNDTHAQYNETFSYLQDEIKILKDTKLLVSKIFNVHLNNIAIAPNFSLAFNIILDGLDNKLSVLMLENDYPSIVLPIKNRKFNHHLLPISADIEDRIYDYVKNNRPGIFVLSITQFLNGLHIKPSFLAKLKSDFPQLLILADATQYLGVEDFDFKKSKIDLMISSCYKWLNAGFGSALVFASDQLKDQLKSKFVGTNSLIDKTKMDLKPMGFLEPGHYEINSIKSLQTALNLHYNLIGIDYIAKHLDELSTTAFEIFQSEKLLDNVVKHRNSHSSIFNLNINQDDLKNYNDEKIYLSIRGNGIRLSLHYYNTQEDLEHFMNVFKSI